MPEHDIVYGRDEIVLAVLSMLGVRRIVWESHDGAWNIWARFLTPRLHRLVVVSEGARVAYVARGIPAARILAVPNGIDVGSFASAESREAARIRLGLSADARVAMYVGRLDGWKGVDTFLESAAFLPVGVEAVVIGGDPAQVEERLRQYPSVRFIGYRPYRELPDNQSAADILVVPNTAKDIVSVRYTSPLKLFAHMASGRPVVASDLPSIREIAGDTVAYVIPDDPKALAEAIGATLLDPVTAHARARRAMERVHRYSWDARAVTIGSFLG
jgi:glycosyltransferase involved in cell wall biosynthesis